MSDRSAINWTDTFGHPVRGFTDCRGATDLSGATRHARGDRADNQPGRSVILGEKEGDGLPVQAREVLDPGLTLLGGRLLIKPGNLAISHTSSRGLAFATPQREGPRQ